MLRNAFFLLKKNVTNLSCYPFTNLTISTQPVNPKWSLTFNFWFGWKTSLTRQTSLTGIDIFWSFVTFFALYTSYVRVSFDTTAATKFSTSRRFYEAWDK